MSPLLSLYSDPRRETRAEPTLLETGTQGGGLERWKWRLRDIHSYISRGKHLVVPGVVPSNLQNCLQRLGAVLSGNGH